MVHQGVSLRFGALIGRKGSDVMQDGILSCEGVHRGGTGQVWLPRPTYPGVNMRYVVRQSISSSETVVQPYKQTFKLALGLLLASPDD